MLVTFSGISMLFSLESDEKQYSGISVSFCGSRILVSCLFSLNALEFSVASLTAERSRLTSERMSENALEPISVTFSGTVTKPRYLFLLNA